MKLGLGSLAVEIVIAWIVWKVFKNYVAPDRDKYLTFWPRFWAPTIDELVLWLPVTFFPYLIYRILALSSHDASVLLSLFYFFYYFYSIYCHTQYGATIGKMTTRVKVVNAADEGPITIKQACIRDAIPICISMIALLYLPMREHPFSEASHVYSNWILSIVGVWFLIELATMLTNKKRRALHDYLAGTVVIRTNLA